MLRTSFIVLSTLYAPQLHANTAEIDFGISAGYSQAIEDEVKFRGGKSEAFVTALSPIADSVSVGIGLGVGSVYVSAHKELVVPEGSEEEFDLDLSGLYLAPKVIVKIFATPKFTISPYYSFPSLNHPRKKHEHLVYCP